MIITITTGQAANMLIDDKNSSWSYNGARALVEYLEDMETQTDTPIEFDRVALRCEWAEYETALEAAEDCGANVEDEERALDWLRNNTSVIEFDGGVIVQKV
jgi:hypothetical protein